MISTHTTTIDNGRLCNQIFRNVACSLIAEKHDLCVTYCSKELIEKLGISLFCGKTIFKETIILNDDNYFSVYLDEHLKSNLNPNNHYFQSKEISNLLYNYLNTDTIKSNIINKNPFNNRYNMNNDLCIHIRLTDTAHFNPGINYYTTTISTIQFDNLYICSDDIHHNIIKEILKIYPNATIIEYDEINTIQFASTCKNIILSHGSYSAIIGYLSFFSNIHYPEYENNKMWYGDMFSINGWMKHNV